MTSVPHIVATSAQFAEAFDANEFDIAGLGDLPTDAQSLRDGLVTAHRWSFGSGELGSANRLALLMFTLLRVAQEDYGQGGAPSYWPHLAQRMCEALPPAERPRGEWSLSPQQQAQFGDWFRDGLRHFGYSVPPDPGRTHVDPIVYHAGVPLNSLPGLIRVIEDACRTYGPAAADLEPAAIADLVAGDDSRLHRNVAKMLRSRIRGVAQLWSSLARVVFAWQTRGEATEEMRQLPVSFPAEAVRDALDHVPRHSAGERPATLPVLRYDPTLGSVRLWLPDGQADEWRVESKGAAVPVIWDRMPAGLAGQFLAPPPLKLVVSHGGLARAFTTQPSRWPGLWFRASTGLLEQGATIDASGVEAGRWYVLFEGTPDDVDLGTRRPLEWSFFAGGQGWTAWEVDVPPRMPERTRFTWRVGTNEFSVGLARRPGPRLAMPPAVAEATTSHGERLQVYAQAPRVTLERDQPVSTVLVRRTDLPTTTVLTLQPHTPTRLPATKPGLYRLHERHGFGRVLMDFAVLPGLAIDGPTAQPGTDAVTLTFRADAAAGMLDGVAPTADGEWRITVGTVEPELRASWRWAAPADGPLNFAWPVPGLRWRVLGLTGGRGRWSRTAIEVTQKEVTATDARLEVHVTAADLSVGNGPQIALQATPAGNAGVIGLMPYVSSEFVRLRTGGGDHLTVQFTRRPVLGEWTTEPVGAGVRVRWLQADVPTGAVLLAWDPLQPATPPTVLPLEPDHIRRAEVTIPRDRLPPGEFLSVTWATVQAGGFIRATETYLHAVATADPGRSAARLVRFRPVPSGGPTDPVVTWAEVAHDVLAALAAGRPPAAAAVAERLDRLFGASDARPPCQLLRQFAEQLPLRFGALAEAVVTDLWAFLRAHQALIILPADADRDRSVCDWLRCGVHVGWSLAQRQAAEADDGESAAAYPFEYFADLARLAYTVSAVAAYESSGAGKADRLLDRLRDAAARVHRFHAAYDLPPPSLGLPWRQRQATVTVPGQEPRALQIVEVHGERNETADQFADELGYDDLALDAKDVETRLRRELQRTQSYSLDWDARKREWTIQRTGDGHNWPAQRFATAGYQVSRPNAAAFGRTLELRDRLIRWVGGAGKSAAVEGLDAAVEAALRADPVTGPLHADLYTPPPVQTQRLDPGKFTIIGRPTVIQHPTAATIPPTVLRLWGLAWVDRLAARRGGDPFFEGGPLVGRRAAFLAALAEALQAQPTLMRRCLACAEFVTRCLFDGGLGLAARFPNTDRPGQRPTVPPGAKP